MSPANPTRNQRLDKPLAELEHTGRPLRRSSVGTLHHQLYVTLSQMIRSGQVEPGERLPTEVELVENYAVSRTTARRALDELRRQGFVTRKPGKGTIVLPPRLDAPIPHLHSITDEIEHLGYKPGAVTLSVTKAPATEHVAERLRLQPGDPVLVVRRVRTADDHPVFASEATLNLVAFPELEDMDFSSRGMYAIFESATGRQLERATQWLSAVPATGDVARMLRIQPGAPVLQLERIVYLAGDVPVENVTGQFHGELYKHYSVAYRHQTAP